MKQIYRFSLLLLALLQPAIAGAYDFEIDGIYYNKNGNNATVTYKDGNYNSYSGDVVIPETVTYGEMNYSVTSIGGFAFAYCDDPIRVTIPNSVSAIGDSAFYRCYGLTSMDIPSSVTTIGSYAFAECFYLASVTIPNSVTLISQSTFHDCRSLMSVTIPSSVTSIGESAFSGCNALTSVDIPNSVTTIGESAFSGSGLISVTIPNSVTTISIGAFQGCSGLTSIDIPNSVTSIDNSALSYTGLTSVDIPSSVTNIGICAFSYCSDLTNVSIPNSITFLSPGIFRDCTSLTSIDIPNSVTAIGEGAFSSSGLTNIDIPNSVTTIGEMAFYSCSSLREISIPYSVTSIDDYAFIYCSGLTEMYCLASTPPSVGSSVFKGCYSATLYVPEEAVNAYRSADGWKAFANIVGIDYVPPVSTFEVDGIYYRINGANAVSVIANEEVEAYYTGDVVIPDSVTYEEDTFAVTVVVNSAFENCYELTSVVIPNSVTTIGEQAFQGCTGLMGVTIGSGLTTIGAKAFNYCNALEIVKCIGTVPPVMASSDCFSTAAYNRATLLVPRQHIETYQAANYWYKFVNINGWGSAGRGDVNEDGSINISDVAALIDYLLSGSWN